MIDTSKILIDSLLIKETEKSFDYLTLLVGIIAFAGVIISSINLWKLQRKTYKDDYYKKIIDKRISAYESLENILESLFIINELGININSKPHLETSLHYIFVNYENFKNFRQKVIKMGTNNFWLSEQLFIEISKFNKFLFEVEKEIKEIIKEDSQNGCQLVGSSHHKSLVNFYVKLRKLHMEDFKNLYLVEEFFNKHVKLLTSIRNT